MNGFVNILEEKFGSGTPIFTEEIAATFPAISEVALFKRINKALSSGTIKRSTRGVYHIPKMVNVLGTMREMPLDQMAVLKKRYLSSDGDVYGYYSGLKLENDAGISPQVPGAIEIVTNRESSRKRSIGPCAGYKDVVVRRSRIPVTKDNVEELRVIDLISCAPIAALEDYQFQALRNKAKAVDRTKILECLDVYPASVTKKFLESERLGVFA
ncbi:MAG: hypothetical protein LBL23_05955 [Coriobacteriales bacterium]|jgi:hypothetical protein|nr:hypothetical protein [Coriobacteriales bacterium]